MGQIRRSNKNKEILTRISQTSDLKEALELMVVLQGRTSMEEECVVKYDGRTGKPIKHAWIPYKKFGTDFTFGGEGYIGDINVHLTDEVVAEIKRGPVSFDKDDRRYVAKFEEKNHPGQGIPCVEHLVYLSQVRNL